jgi:ABC-type transport system substrate-binding protein
MAMHLTAPQAKEAVDRYGDQYGLNKPVGCGPFVLESYKTHQSIVLARNPNAPTAKYPSEADPSLSGMLADAGKSIPFVDHIYLSIIQEPVTQYNLFQQGYLDSLEVNVDNAAAVPSSNGLSAEMKARGIKLEKVVQIQFDYVGFNMEDSVVGGYTPAKRKLRQAISLALDSSAYISLVDQGMAKPAQWIVPPGLSGNDPAYVNRYRQYDPSLKQAKQLLAEAGYPNGLDSIGQRLVIHFDNYATTPIRREAVRLFKQEIEQLGVQVELRESSESEFNDKLIKKQAQVFNYGWFADYPDPENFTFLLYGGNISPGPNCTNYANPAYDRLFEKMRSMNDGPERMALIKQMRDISAEDCPLVYLVHAESRTLTQPWIRNVSTHPMANDQHKYAAIDWQMRNRLIGEWNRSVYWPAVLGVLLIVAVVVPASGTIRSRVNRRVRRAGSPEEGGAKR